MILGVQKNCRSFQDVSREFKKELQEGFRWQFQRFKEFPGSLRSSRGFGRGLIGASRRFKTLHMVSEELQGSIQRL